MGKIYKNKAYISVPGAHVSKLKRILSEDIACIGIIAIIAKRKQIILRIIK